MNFIEAIESSCRFRRPDMIFWLTIENGYICSQTPTGLHLVELKREDFLAKDWIVNPVVVSMDMAVIKEMH